MKKRKIVSTLLALLLLASLPVSALAADVGHQQGRHHRKRRKRRADGHPGSRRSMFRTAPPSLREAPRKTPSPSTRRTDQTANVTLSDVNIDVSSEGKAAVTTTGEGNVSIELNGGQHAQERLRVMPALKRTTAASLTIADEDKNGKLTAEGGKYGAGIGGGDQGAGSGITITGGEIKATGGQYGAGIGGGKGDGSDITISGGEVNATGGTSGAGIGGGSRGTGSDITISGGEVNASGGVNGAGIGGGLRSKGKDITVSGDTKLKVQGGDEDHYDGAGAGIGDGGSNAYGTKILGAEVEPDTSGLTTNGSIAYYAPGADMENDKPTSITFGTSSQPEKPIEPAVPEQPEAERGMDAPLYRVTDKDGRDIVYTAERKDGVLTVNVDEDFAILTGRLSGIRTLKAQGVEKIIFVTKGAASAFLLSDLLEKGESGDTYKLTHDGKAVTFTLGEKMTDVSAILTKP